MELPEELKKYVDGEVTFKQVGTAICDSMFYTVRDKDSYSIIKEQKVFGYLDTEGYTKFNIYNILNSSSECVGCSFIIDGIDSLSNQKYEQLEPIFLKPNEEDLLQLWSPIFLFKTDYRNTHFYREKLEEFLSHLQPKNDYRGVVSLVDDSYYQLEFSKDVLNNKNYNCIRLFISYKDKCTAFLILLSFM